MRGFLIAILTCSFVVLVNPELVQAQNTEKAVLEGRIVNAETGEPLHGAHIFLSGTTIGTVSNASGRFSLRGVSPGVHRLVISMIGFGRTSEDITVRSGEAITYFKELKPVVYEMEDIFVGNLDDRWKRYLERFTRLFIGESERADSVMIKNPEVLRFDSRWWGRFTAEALAPLEIENHKLGYRIIYYLDEFYHSGTVTRWDGEPLFTEMAPKDSLQAAYWKENRREAFYGSLRHFFLALYDARVRDEGFAVYRLNRDIHGFSRHNRYRANPERLVRKADEEQFLNFNFSGRLEIIYTKKEEDPRYVRWARDIRRGPARTQTSYLELNKRPITIDPDGEIKETYGATRFGYFAFHRLADATPRDYRPEQWQVPSGN
jgi:hypothetical protein